jgi:uncharacterized protein YggE
VINEMIKEYPMKSKFYFLTSILLFAALLSGCAGAAFAQSSTPTGESTVCAPCQTSPRTMNVNGSGKAYLTPDIAYVNIGVHTEGPNAAETVAENSTQSQAVLDALIKLGIDKKDILTTNFSIYPQQQYDTDGKPTGKMLYQVDNTVYVTVRDIEQVGEVLDKAVASGANSINGIQFDVADKTAALSEARKAAVSDAQDKAAELAQASGITLGAIQTISEYTSGSPMPVMYDTAMVKVVEASSVPVSTGQLTITIEVNIVYEIK